MERGAGRARGDHRRRRSSSNRRIGDDVVLRRPRLIGIGDRRSSGVGERIKPRIRVERVGNAAAEERVTGWGLTRLGFGERRERGNLGKARKERRELLFLGVGLLGWG